MSESIISPKKLIEVALPLDAINAAAAREKSIRHGHPSTLHLWWARRPLAAARAVIFSQLVHDPEDLWRCQNPGVEPNKQVKGHWTKARARFFKIIEDLVLWENTTNESVLQPARDEIRKAWIETCELNTNHPRAEELFDPDNMPGLHDPFAGGGAIPLEAQRLGLEAYASDLNPVAVLINKAMIEIPPKFAGRSPVNPESRYDKGAKLKTWHGSQGLAEDVRYYGQWMREEAFKRIGHLYPPVEITAEMVKERPDLKSYLGEKLQVIAWLWARTVKSPNPAFSSIHVPLASTFVLSKKSGKQAYIQPIVDKNGCQFTVKVGPPPAGSTEGTKLTGTNFRCLVSGSAIEASYVRSEAQSGRLGSQLLAVIAEGERGQVYLSPTDEMQKTASLAKARWKPDLIVPTPCHDVDRLPMYGMPLWGDAFMPRQLAALDIFADLIDSVRSMIITDCGQANSAEEIHNYADAITTYLGLAIGRSANYWSAFTPWADGFVVQTFGRNAIRMVWDHAEVNVFSSSTGNWSGAVEWIQRVIRDALPANRIGRAVQADAQHQSISHNMFVSTDPPYYDNIGYANLSEFFYVWLRRALRPLYPDLFATIGVPKTEELVASAERHGGKKNAEQFFLEGMSRAMKGLALHAHPAYPLTIYYAFKQSETQADIGTMSTGWETFLTAVVSSGFTISGTWPMRTERSEGLKSGSNSLASSVVLVCRARESNASSISRRQFIRALNETLPISLDAMTRESEGLHSPVAPVDLSQAIIGPGMAVFSKYAAVLEADGSPMSVDTALRLINRFLAEDDFDADTQFCLRWFEQHHWDAGQFGEADVLARAKGTSVEGVKQSGVVAASNGKVQLVRPADYPANWDPATDQRLPIWEALHQMIRIFRSDGETATGQVLSQIQSKAEAVRQLAYRLYTLCERTGLADDARAYNELITSWTGIETAAAKEPAATQRTLFEH